MEKKVRVTIVTPCLNAERHIAETVSSVLQQTAVLSGRVELEYIIRDGGSSDRTLEIVRSFASPALTLCSEPDRGLYDALAKGLRQASGQVCAYINAGDLYERHALDVVLDVMESRPVSWLTGINALYNEKSQIVGFHLPFRYRRRLFASGLYGRRLRFVQQESTFWRAELLSLVDLERLSGFRLAGDYYLWHSFANSHELTVVQALLGGFRVHARQLSRNLSAYLDEMQLFTHKPNIWDWLLAWHDFAFWHMPVRIKKRRNPRHLLLFDHERQTWR